MGAARAALQVRGHGEIRETCIFGVGRRNHERLIYRIFAIPRRRQMAKMFWEKDANPRALEGKRIAVLGYGSQGRAHALNLRDSGLDVVVGLRKGGPSWQRAQAEGFAVAEPAEAVRGADLVTVLTPDMVQPALYKDAIEPNI